MENSIRKHKWDMDYTKQAYEKLARVRSNNPREVDIIFHGDISSRFTMSLPDDLLNHMLASLRKEHDTAKDKYDAAINALVSTEQNQIHELWRGRDFY